MSKKIIYEVNSEKNGKLSVVDYPSGRVLQTEEEAILSCSENYKYLDRMYWGTFLEEIKKYRPTIKRALIFGLGGGAIQNNLFKIYPGIEIVSIEYDSTIIDIYNYFFGGDKYSNHKIFNVDAKDFVSKSHKLGDYEGYFDLVFIDTFSSFQDSEYEGLNSFYSQTKKFLNPKGLYALNMIVKTDTMFEKSKPYLANLKTHYKETNYFLIGTVFGNSNLVTFSSDKLNL